MEHTENQITLRGSLLDLPVYSHENHGKKFYRFTLEVRRLSGAADRLPVIASEEVLNDMDLSAGSMIRAEGQIRSHNLRKEDGRHLQVFLFASALTAEEGEDMNEVSLSGNLCREPVLRKTPLGRDICDIMLAVPRAFHRADYLPCILWGSTAQEAACCHTGDCIRIQGRLQSREYNKITDSGTEVRTAYEISAMTADIPWDLY